MSHKKGQECPDSILIIRLKSIGEVVMCLSLVEAVRNQWAKARIGFVVEPPHQELLEADHRIDRIHLFSRKEWQKQGLGGILRGFGGFIRELRRERYEYVLDLHGVERSQVVARLAGGKRRVGRARGHWLTDRFLHEVTPVVWEGQHNIEMSFRIAEKLGVQNAPVPPRLILSEEARTFARQWLREQDWHEIPVVAFHPGTSSRERVWPPERFIELGRLIVERLNARILITAGPGEESLGQDIAEAIGGGYARMAAIGHLLRLAALLESCALFVASDTGPLHMAAAVGTPVVAVYGYSDPARSGPYGSGHAIVYKALDCSPCNSFVFQCDHKSCFRLITAEDVFEKVGELFQHRAAGKSCSEVSS